MTDTDHNYGVAAGELRQLIEQAEAINAEKAKARGFATKVMRKIIAERKRDKDDLAEENALADMYRAALGMGE